MADITRDAYWTEIGELAKSITEEAHANGNEDLHAALHETIDSHSWVIYTSNNYDVAKHSDNDDAWTDLYGGGDVPENFDAVRAFCAMERDVSEHSDFGKLACTKCGDVESIEDLDENTRCTACPVDADHLDDDAPKQCRVPGHSHDLIPGYECEQPD